MKTSRHLVPAPLDWPLRILLITTVLIGFFFLIDTIDNTPGTPIYSSGNRPKAPWETVAPGRPEIIGYEIRYTWAFKLSLYIGIIGLYLAGIFFVIQLAKRHERNVVAWTTAAIVFTPVLTVIAYLLTWPKGKYIKG